jgi:hypothetical protein
MMENGFGLVWFGLVWSGVVWFGVARFFKSALHFLTDLPSDVT